MEEKKEEQKKEIGLTTIELELPQSYVDDESIFSPSISWKRRLSIIEKFFKILVAIAAIPFSSYIATFIPVGKEGQKLLMFHPFDEDLWSVTLIPFVISFVLLIAVEFYIKNVSITDGVLKTTIYSLFFSSAINVTVFALCTSFRRITLYQGVYYQYIALGAISACVYTLLLLILRIFLECLLKLNKKKVMIVGPKSQSQDLAKRIIKEDFKKYSIRYVFYEENGEISEDIYAKVKKVNTIILLDSLTAKTKQSMLLYFSSCKNKDVFLCSSYYDIVFMDGTIGKINEKMVFEQRPLYIDYVESFVKRAFDIFVSLVFLICLSPLMILTAICIKLNDGGPVFYKQTRLTKGMKEFKIIKFRSMKVGSDEKKPAEEHDSRITKIGKIIRATKIDELPQVINILKGDMSWVGPRPLIPKTNYESIHNNPLYAYKFNVKTGLTGLQQIFSTSHTTQESKLKYDLYYIQHQSLIFDMSIMFRTVGVVFNKSMSSGTYEEELALSMEDFLDEQDYNFKDYGSYLSIFKRTDNK